MDDALYIDINPEALKELATFPADRPLYMVNLLKYRERDEASGKSGREMYREYIEKATPFFEHINARISFKATPELMIIGPSGEQLWDELLIVTYDTKDDFFKLIQMEGYPPPYQKAGR